MKKTILASLFLILALPFSVQAHTTLTASTPSEGEMIEEALEEVQLTFGTVVEQESTMTIEGENKSYQFKNITVTENRMTGTLEEDLANGAYTVQWKIIGADGHPIEGEIPFGMNIENAEEPVVEDEATADEEPVVESEKPEEQAAADGEEKSNTLVTVLIAAAVLLIVAGMFSLFKKKQ
ncbi:hypothetical protein B0H99_12228 [Planomicrobium soli]|uniref:CopC domain-containing protein n=1 Tax=Planomicrobium soli TaxID=1176648 RepID=A0A2P8FTL9_9BACL|nr:copper resistance CopC family protein [Planomicrobium soli]PSL25077.1 hypothetical protein B0H99_12228 [Planomicrobium soli]